MALRGGIIMYTKKAKIEYKEISLNHRDSAIEAIQMAFNSLDKANKIYDQFLEDFKDDAIKHAALTVAKEACNHVRGHIYNAIEYIKTMDHPGVIEQLKKEDGVVTKVDSHKEITDRLLQTIQKITDERNDLLRERDGEVWIWQGDDDDHLESLACPILIRPEQLRDIIVETNKKKPISNCDDLISQAGDYPGGHSDD